MSNMNGNATKWLAIIISIIIAMVSLSIGVIRTSNKEQIQDLKRQVERHNEVINQMKQTEVRLDMRLSNIEQQTTRIDKKIDILLSRGDNAK